MNSADPLRPNTWHKARQLCAIAAVGVSLIVIAGCGGSGSNAGPSPANPAANTLVPATGSSTPLPPLEGSGLSTPQGQITAPSTPPSEQSTPNAGTLGPPATVSVSFTVPSAVTQSLVHRQSLQRSFYGESHDASRALQYISVSNVSLKTVVTPTGGGSTTYNGACSTVTCTVSFTATAGPTTLAFSLTDGAAGTGNTLSTYSTLVIVRPNGLNTFAFTANPVVDHVTLSLASTTITAGTAADVLLSVNAKDIDNNTIIGQGNYVNASGNPLSLLINVKNSQAGGQGSAVFHGPTYISAPSQAATYLHYNGGWLDHADVTVTATKTTAGGLTGATLTTIPHATEYAVGLNAHGITAGPDGNIWFTEFTANAIGKMTPSGALTSYSCGACVSPIFITPGPDGNMWFTELSGSYVDKITPGGVATRVASLPGQGNWITLGPDGNLWWTSDTVAQVGKVSPNGVLSIYASGTIARGIGRGPDDNLWYMSKFGTSITKMASNGNILGSYPIVNDGNNSDGVVSGPDGNVWFVNNGSSLIEKVTTTGVVTSYALQIGAAPRTLVVGPDGYLWFSEQGTNTIGRISTSGLLQEYSGTNGISASSGPVGITVGPDGNIWFAEYGINKVAKFVL